ncbi:hypothetical protein [Scytonema sp. NUACC26]|uniref:hypothetical protein n=1 Tax=Scytonema sp. NUACC26 TaxID=3140176 RepID=UPI0034DBCECB
MSMRSNSCPCCGDCLLRHVRHGEVYWFCKTCWQEIPLLTVNRLSKAETRNLGVVDRVGVKN